jgi:sugar lactone lactonase YvrE
MERHAGAPRHAGTVFALVALAALAALVALAAAAIGTMSVAGAAASTGGPSAVMVVGNGRPGFGGDGGPAAAARLDRPAGIAVDGDGDLFIADTDNCRIREVPAVPGTRYGMAMQAHRIYTVAGNGCDGAGSRPGAIGYPTGVAVDRSGDLFIADATGNRIFELTASGDRRLGAAARATRLSPVAGTGTAGFSGDGGPAAAAELDGPAGVAVDGAGDLFIADTDNCRIRMVPAASGDYYGVAMEAHSIHTVAGTGICGVTGVGGPASRAQLWTPTALAMGGSDDLLIGDRGAGYVLQLPRVAGTYYGQTLGPGDLGFVAGAGIYAPFLTDGLPALGTTAELNFPDGLAVGPNGTLVVADTGEKVIREIPAADGTSFGRAVTAGHLYTVAGSEPTGTNLDSTTWIATTMSAPCGVGFDAAGDLYWSDQRDDTVGEIRPPG